MLGSAVCALLVIAAIGSSPAQAAEDYTFDAELSLTGDCSTSPVDPVPDPGPCPGLAGIDHPTSRFEQPCGVAVDSHGYIYVSSTGDTSNQEARIDVFTEQGEFVLEVEDTAASRSSCGLAVDSACNLYVDEVNGPPVYYTPDSCPPTPSTNFGAPTTIGGHVGTGSTAVAVDRSNDHLYLLFGTTIEEYDSLANGAALLRTIPLASLGIACAGDLDIFSANHNIALSGCPHSGEPQPLVPRVFVIDGTTGERKQTLTGAAMPTAGFGFNFGKAGVAIDQSTGDLRVSDFADKNLALFDSPGSVTPGQEAPEAYLGCIGNHKSCDPVFKGFSPPFFYADIAVDDSGGANDGYIYVTSGSDTANSHLWAFAPVPPPAPPSVCCEQVSQISDTEALLEGQIKPGGLRTSYRFEYTTESQFLMTGFTDAIRVPVDSDGDAGAGGAFASVSEPLTGLAPDTAFRFRLVATNHCQPLAPNIPCETAGPGGRFATYPVPRRGLPDGRNYELVSPPDTNGRIPTGGLLGWQTPGGFPTALSRADGTSLIFGTEGGTLPQAPGSGLYDLYQAVRTDTGWATRLIGPSGSQASSPRPGGVSPDHHYATLYTEFADEGTLGPPESNYLRHPDGRFELIGLGSLGTDLRASSRLITAGAEHIIFVSGEGSLPSVRLEPAAAPSGTDAIYDRSPGGATRVISLLPGDIPLLTGQDAKFLGASVDGSDIAFSAGGTMYVRRNNSTTVPVVSNDAAFAGVLGGRVFYLKEPTSVDEVVEGELFACELGANGCVGTGASEPIQIGAGGKSTVVNISADGNRVYFISPEQLDGARGQLGADNLYIWDGAVRFIATLAPQDVIGDQYTGFTAGGLGLWTSDTVAPAYSKYVGPANNPSRATADGSVLIFESRANLTPSYDSNGHREIYRYDAEGDQLLCLSCNPTRLPATSDAALQAAAGKLLAPFPPVNAITPVSNLTRDGKVAYFQSSEALVAGDVDRKIDVYQWTAHESAGCSRIAGCLDLISSGQSATDDYLYAVTPDGSSVFFQSGDNLVREDVDAIPSLFVARVGGGFPEPPPAIPCQEDRCQGAPSTRVTLPTPASSSLTTEVRRQRRRCPKGKRKVRRSGKQRCAKTKRKRGQHHRGGAK
jgi:hypothetical protein